VVVDLEGVSNNWLIDSTFSANLTILASLISLAIGLPDLLSTCSGSSRQGIGTLALGGTLALKLEHQKGVRFRRR